jgi:hypothetical protein
MLKERQPRANKKLCSQTGNYFFGDQTLKKIMVTNFSKIQDFASILKNGHL